MTETNYFETVDGEIITEPEISETAQETVKPVQIVRTTHTEHTKALEPVDTTAAFRFAQMAIKAGLHQQYKSPEQALLAVMKGRVVGLDAVTALESIHVIQGKTMVKAEILIALVKRSPLCEYFMITNSDNETATWETKRKTDPKPVTISFTAKDAEQLGLLTKDNWKKQRATMLRWRAGSLLARLVYPDLTNGIYGLEEFE